MLGFHLNEKVANEMSADAHVKGDQQRLYTATVAVEDSVLWLQERKKFIVKYHLYKCTEYK